MGSGQPLPDAPPDVIGVMNLRGSVILVIDQVSDILSISGDQVQPVPDLGTSFDPSFSHVIIPLERHGLLPQPRPHFRNTRRQCGRRIDPDLGRKQAEITIENDIRGLPRNFGLKVGVVGVGKFEERVRDLFGLFRNYAISRMLQ